MEQNDKFDINEFADAMHVVGIPFIVIDGSVFEDPPAKGENEGEGVDHGN